MNDEYVDINTLINKVKIDINKVNEYDERNVINKTHYFPVISSHTWIIKVRFNALRCSKMINKSAVNYERKRNNKMISV